MSEFFVWLIIIGILASAIGYVVAQKRKGVKCVGCGSEAGCCASKPNSQHISCACEDSLKKQ